MRMHELIKSATTDLRDWAESNPGEEPFDIISEIADSSVPVYDSDLLELAADDPSLVHEEPEIIAYDGTPTVINILAGAVYQRIVRELHERWDEIREEIEEERHLYCSSCGLDVLEAGQCEDCGAEILEEVAA